MNKVRERWCPRKNWNALPKSRGKDVEQAEVTDVYELHQLPADQLCLLCDSSFIIPNLQISTLYPAA